MPEAKKLGLLETFAGIADGAADVLETLGVGVDTKKLRDGAERARSADARLDAARARYEESPIPGVLDSAKKALDDRRASVLRKHGKRTTLLRPKKKEKS